MMKNYISSQNYVHKFIFNYVYTCMSVCESLAREYRCLQMVLEDTGSLGARVLCTEELSKVGVVEQELGSRLWSSAKAVSTLNN